MDDDSLEPAGVGRPSDQHFAFSAGGTAYFIVGLHPAASRDARRTPTPTLVFNLHEQFEELRASGRFPRMRDKIRSATCSCRARSTRWWPTTGGPPRRGSTPAARSVPAGQAPFPTDEKEHQ